MERLAFLLFPVLIQVDCNKSFCLCGFIYIFMDNFFLLGQFSISKVGI